jgi:hypothetical protein
MSHGIFASLCHYSNVSEDRKLQIAWYLSGATIASYQIRRFASRLHPIFFFLARFKLFITFLFFPDNFEVIKSVYFLQNVKKRELLRKTN